MATREFTQVRREEKLKSVKLYTLHIPVATEQAARIHGREASEKIPCASGLPTMPSGILALPSVPMTTTLQGRDYWSHFTDMEMEAWGAPFSAGGSV